MDEQTIQDADVLDESSTVLCWLFEDHLQSGVVLPQWCAPMTLHQYQNRAFEQPRSVQVGPSGQVHPVPEPGLRSSRGRCCSRSWSTSGRSGRTVHPDHSFCSGPVPEPGLRAAAVGREGQDVRRGVRHSAGLGKGLPELFHHSAGTGWGADRETVWVARQVGHAWSSLPAGPSEHRGDGVPASEVTSSTPLRSQNAPSSLAPTSSTPGSHAALRIVATTTQS